jgi:hypothetical protein
MADDSQLGKQTFSQWGPVLLNLMIIGRLGGTIFMWSGIHYTKSSASMVLKQFKQKRASQVSGPGQMIPTSQRPSSAASEGCRISGVCQRIAL